MEYDFTAGSDADAERAFKEFERLKAEAAEKKAPGTSVSTFAYQYWGYNKRVSKETLQQLYQIAVGDFKPDLTIILDIDPKIGLERSFNKAKSILRW